MTNQRSALRTSSRAVTLAAVAALGLLTACGTESGSGGGSGSGSSGAGDGRSVDSDVPDVPVTGVHWSVTSLTVDGEKLDAPDRAYVQFDAKGQAGGNYGCNLFGAEYTAKGKTLTVRPISTTEMHCGKKIQKFEDAFASTFKGDLTAKVTDGRLTLTTEDGDTVELAEEKPAPLKGTKWTVTAFAEDDGESFVSLPPAAEGKAHFRIAKDGTVGGNLGCNDFTSKAEITDTELTFELPVTTTRKMCEKGQMTAEDRLRKVFDGTVQYEVKHHAIVLTKDGEGLHATAPGPQDKQQR
ncbi:META domain-containing protein [Streptomyces apocyni]|uniref:META domain-containing protein n=1 Tax=Streptomyces apocyni TaxID=2654677 RepID=UPI0012EAFE38|nr:META domain-containing protein [Streptomyces apocyni]